MIEEGGSVSTWQVKKCCLNCKYYRLVDTQSGLCRIDKRVKQNDCPQMKNEDICERWVDCGQQYYIRKGWIKGQDNKDL